MKILVTGAKGQLGQAVCRALRWRGDHVVPVDAEDFDLTDNDAVRSFVEETQPSAIIHCAAYTAVDKAESEPETSCLVNAGGTLNIARAALSVNAALVYISTDYVFAGQGTEPQETDAPKGPLNVYGLGKLQGEDAIRSLMTRYYIVRTSWVFSAQGSNFVKAIRRLAREKRELRVVGDQVGSPTYAPDLAAFLAALVHSGKYGVYHATNEGECSWAEFAEAIIRGSGLRARVIPVTTAEWKSAARRPLNSRLSKASLDNAGFSRLPPWQDALERCLAELAAAPED